MKDLNNKKIRVLMTAGGSSTIGGINIWANHILEYGKEHQDNIRLDAVDAGRRDFTSFKDVLYKRLLFGIYAYIIFCIRIFGILKNNKFDILHIVSAGSYGLIRDLLLIYIAKAFNVRSVVHFHFGRIPEIKSNNNWEWKILKKVVEKSNGVIVLDRASKDSLEGLSVRILKQLPNPIAPIVFNLIQSKPNLKRDEKLVLYVGQCYREKGIFEIVEACRQIPNIKCRLVGSVNEEIKSNLLKNNKLDNSFLEIIGKKNFEEVISEMLQCGVFVLPSYSEGFPNVILEAMACGCPIVTTDVGAIPEMLDIDGDNNYGICVKPKDVDGLKAAINKMLDDRSYAIECGNNAKRRVNELYSMPKVWEQLVHIWKFM